MNTTEEENQIPPDMVDQNIDKFLNALLIVFHEIGAEPAEGERLFAESSLALDDQGFFRYILPDHFVYALSEEELKRGGFGESSNETVIPIVDDRYFVVVAQ